MTIVGTIFHKISNFFEVALLLIKWFYINIKSGNSDSAACLVGKTAIVTGGNSGIGYATSVLLASRGCRVIIACRSDATVVRKEIIERTGNPNIETRKLDLNSLKSVRKFAENILKSETKIDILINNAGSGRLPIPNHFSDDGLISLLQTNYFGHFLLTHLILGPLKAAGRARILFMSSVLAIFQNLHLDSLTTYYGDDKISLLNLYSNSKYLNTLAAQEFGKKLRIFGITVNAVDPGSANTSILDGLILPGDFSSRIAYYLSRIIARDLFNATQTSLHLASSEKLEEETGQLYFRCQRFPKYGPLLDEEFCDKIWNKSEELVGLKPEEKITHHRRMSY